MIRDFQIPGRSAVFARNGMCATSHPLASRTAVRILEDGGNAVDAAIAAALVLGICEPQSTGIGGDCFALVKPAGSETILGINGSGRAPAAACPVSLRRRGWTSMTDNGPESITIPGAVDAFCRLSADHGRMDIGRVLQPAIKYAEEGVPVAPRVSVDWYNSCSRLKGPARDHYLFDGHPPACGDLFRARGQAEVLRKVASEGRSGFYEGEVAADMVDSLREIGGVHDLKDFASTSCIYTDPISVTYGGVELVEHPPNGQGAMALLLANILSHFDLGKLDPLGAERTHIEAEATRLAMDARDRFIGDPDHVNRLKHMLSGGTAEKLAGMIMPEQVICDLSAKTDDVHHHTVYLAVVDRDLMAVSMIYSIFSSFGSGHASRKFGINFHNRGSSFSLLPGHPNELGPGKRPLHTIIPAMLRRGGMVFMPFGVMGAHFQSVGHARFLTNLVDYHLDPQAALDMPRSFAYGGALQLERGYRDPVRAQLSSWGHDVITPDMPLGGGQAIMIDHARGLLVGASDPRKDGCAIGY